MNINYDSPFNFKPFASITPMSDYWQNSTWGFNMPEITPDTAYAPSFIDVILKGNTALTLVNAKADSLEYLKLFGDTEQLPETYLDTVVLSGGCEQRNLPSGYTQVEYIESTGTQYIDTGIIASNTTGFDIAFQKTVNNNKDAMIIGSRNGTDGRFWVDIDHSSNYGGEVLIGWNTYLRTGLAVGLNKTRVAVNYNNNRKVYINGVENAAASQGLRSVLSTQNIPLYLFCANVSGAGVSYLGSFKLFNIKITVESTLARNLIPCRRNSDNVLGMYDTVTNTFLTNAGSGTFTAGADVTAPSPSQPLPINCNNGAIKVSKNLFNANVVLSGTMDTSGRDGSPNSTRARLEYLYLPTGTYIISNNGNTVNQILGASYSDNTGSNFSSIDDWAWHNLPFIFTLTSNRYVRFMVRNSSDVELTTNNIGKFQIELGSTATTYMPYGQIYTQGTVETVTDSNGLTANAEMLLAVGDYKDTQEVLSGSVTRNIGIKVLDGTENWVLQSINQYGIANFNTYITSVENGVYLCSHFERQTSVIATTTTEGFLFAGTSTLYIRKYSSTASTPEELKAWLASEYAKGTPVIVVYPLATTTSEAVSGQFLSKSPVEQTSGSISNLPIAITESAHTVPTPTQPLQINCNNGVVKVSKNLFDKNKTYSSGSGTRYWSISVPNGTYTCSTNVPRQNPSVSNAWFDNTNNFSSSTNPVADNEPRTITVTNGVLYFAIRYESVNPTYYDNLINGTYWAQIEQGSTVTTYRPYGTTYTDGTTETVEITGKNLYNPTTSISGKVLTDTGSLISSPTGLVSDYILVMPNTSYTLKFTRTDQYVYTRVCSYSSANESDFLSLLVKNETVAAGDITATFTTDSTARYIRVSFKNDSTNVQLELGSTATDYKPYFNGGQATAENLFKVGTYQDVQSVIDGGVTRNVGIKVLDGSESWTASATTGKFFISTAVSEWNTISRNATGYCTHAVFNPSGTSDNGKVNFDLNSFCFYYSTSSTTLTAFKQFLSDQYQAGFPVIIVYPLAEPTTETVTAQPMNIQAGTNIVQITQASMDDLELEVKYKAGVTVTITEIENAQLDNNVEVTING